MSKTVDSRVVEMRFDNKQFEAGVATSMSTLDKLKTKLNMAPSAKGLENVGAAVKKVDMSGLSAGVESVNAKFSAMQVVGVTALANITNSAVNAGKKMIKALTLDPITTGFQEYETKINAVQTIMSNTASKGTTMADVTRVLDELNTYADKTIYNFAEMTRNIGTFTAAGVGLEDSASAIQGIANLAAMSGSNSQQASTAMYQLSQALAAGTVKLMDWNSVVNAGMGGQKFQDALKQTAREMGISVDDIIKKQGSFRESLKEGWITADVLNTTLKKLTVEGATEYAESMVKSGKYTREQADALIKEAKAAEDAATKVKTFTQLWDTTKEAVQSGWAKTWELIIGDFEEAKNLLTPISDFLNNIIEKFSEARNKLLESALGKGFGKLSDTLSKAFGPVKKVTEGLNKTGKAIENISAPLKDLGKVVDDVIIGKFGNGKERFDKLTKAGQNYYKVQNKVNKTLGNSFRYSKKQIEAQDKLLNTQKKSNKSTKESSESTKELTKSQKENLKTLAKMSDEQLRSKGYTEDQIDALNELRKTAEKLGMPIDEFIDKMDKLNGRMLLIESFKNIGEAIGKIFSSIGNGFRAVFDAITPDQLFNAIAGFHRFTEQLIISDETADKLARTFKGLFAILDLVTTIFGGGLKIVFTVIESLLDGMGLGILDLTATIGDMVAKFNKWFKDSIFSKFIEKIVEKIPEVIDKLREFIDSLNIGEGAASAFKTVAEGLYAAFELIHSGITLSLGTGLKILGSVLNLFGTNLADAAVKISELIIKFRDWAKENTIFIGSINKIGEIISKIIESITKLAKQFIKLEPVQKLIEKLKDSVTGLFDNFDFDFKGGFLDGVLSGIENLTNKISEWLTTLGDSEHFGIDLVKGLANGIYSGIKMAIGAIVDLGISVIEAIKGVFGIHSPSRVMFSIGTYLILGLLLGIKSIMPELFSSIQSLFSGIVLAAKDILEKGLPGLWSAIKMIASKLKDAISEMDLDMGSLFIGGVLIAALLLIKKALDIADTLAGGVKSLNGVIDGVKGVLDKFQDVLKAKKFEIYANAIKSFSIAIAILVGSIYVLSGIKVGDLIKAGIALGVLTGIIIALMFAASKFDKIGDFNFGKISLMMLGLGVTLILMSKALKMIADIDPERSSDAVGALVVLIIALTAVVAALGGFLKADQSDSIGKAGGMLLKMAIAIGILALVLKAISCMSWGEIGKGSAVIAGLLALFGGILFLFKFVGAGGESASKAGSMFLKMAIAIGALVLIMKLISGMTPGEIFKGLAVIVTMELLFAGVMVLSSVAGANASKAGSMFLKMALAIGILVICIKAIAELSAGDVFKGLAVITAIEILFAGIMILSSFAGANAGKAGLLFLGMAAAIGMLAISIKIIAGLSLGDVFKGLMVVTAVMTLFAAVMILSSFAGNNADKAGAMFIKMAGAILIISVSIALLAMLKPSDVILGTACITLLLGMFALIMNMSQYVTSSHKTILMMAIVIGLLAGSIVALSFLEPAKVVIATACISALLGIFALIELASKNVTKSVGTLLVLTMAIGLIAGSIYALSQVPSEQAVSSATALSIVMLSMAAAIKIIGSMKSTATSAIPTIAAMTLVVGALSGILALMTVMGVENAIPNAIGLSILIEALAAAMLLLDKVKGISETAILAMATMSLCIALLSGVLGLMTAMNVQNAIPNAIALSTLLLAMSAALLITSKIHTVSPIAIAGLGAMVLVIGLLGVVLGLMQHFNIQPSIEMALALSTLLLAMSGALVILGVVGAMGPAALIGVGILAAAITGLGAVMIAIGALMEYVPALEEFLDKGIVILGKIGEGLGLFVGNLVGGVLEGIGDSLPRFGAMLGAFWVGALPFITGLNGLDPNVAEGAKNLALAILAITGADLIQSLTSWLTGGVNMEDFGTQLAGLGKAMKTYSNEVAGLDGESIKNSATAAKALVEVVNALPKEGGLWQSLAGESDLASFGTKLVAFGAAMKLYALQVAGIDNAAITASAEAAKGLTEVAKAVPKEGGLWQSLSGESDISSFGTKLVAFGIGMKSYASSVAGIDTEAIVASAEAAKGLTEVAKNIPKEDGWWQKLAGSKDIGSFGTKLVEFGEGLKSYGDAVAGIDNEAITSSANAAKKIVSVVKSTSGLDTSGVTRFVNAIKKLGSAKVSDISEAFADASNASKLVKIGVNMVKSVGKGLSSTESSVVKTAKKISSSIAKAFDSSKDTAKKSGNNLASALIKGIEAKESSVKKAGTNVGKKASSGASSSSNISSMKSAGKDLGDGLVSGIEAKENAAYWAGYDLGKAAVKGEKDGQESNSPSKATKKAGIWLGEGLIVGIKTISRKVTDAGKSMGKNTVSTISRSLSGIGSMLDSDMDVQPVITPVVDFDGVKSGVKTINGMFDRTFGVHTESNIGAINTMMNRRNQNGVTAEIISEIDKLRKDVRNIEAANYNINGITYSNGSDIQEAIQILVRAAKMERRV